jgi:hypothetical protein
MIETVKIGIAFFFEKICLKKVFPLIFAIPKTTGIG